MVLSSNDFDFLQELGSGTFGYPVKLAKLKESQKNNPTFKSLKDNGNADYYMIKICPKNTIKKQCLVPAAFEERDILKAIDHNFIQKLFATFKDDTHIYLVKETVNSGEIYTHLSREKIFANKDAKFYAAQCVEIFRYLHERNILHRDLKPENLLLQSNGYAKMADFSIAKRLVIDGRPYKGYVDKRPKIEENKIVKLRSEANATSKTNGIEANEEANTNNRPNDVDITVVNQELSQALADCLNGANGADERFGELMEDAMAKAIEIKGINENNLNENSTDPQEGQIEIEKPEIPVLTRNNYEISPVKSPDQIASEIRTYTTCGTPDYFAPEVIKSTGFGLPADWWTLGVLTYEMLVGKPPFEANEVMNIYRKITKKEVEFPDFSKVLNGADNNASVNRDISTTDISSEPVKKVHEDAKNFIISLLNKNPDRRLGNRTAGAADVMNCKWFENIDFDELKKEAIECPFKIPDPSPDRITELPIGVHANFALFPKLEESKEKFPPVVGADDPFVDWDMVV